MAYQIVYTSADYEIVLETERTESIVVGDDWERDVEVRALPDTYSVIISRSVPGWAGYNQDVCPTFDAAMARIEERRAAGIRTKEIIESLPRETQ